NALRARMNKKLAALRASGEPDRLRKRIAELEKDIAQGNRNLATLPPERHAAVIEVLQGFEADRDQLAKELQELDNGEKEIAETIRLAEARLWKLREVLQSADSGHLRSVFRELLTKIELRFTHTHHKQITRSKFSHGVLHVRHELGGASHLDATSV